MAWLMDTETGYASCQICTAITRTTLNSVFSVLDNLRKVNCIVGFIYLLYCWQGTQGLAWNMQNTKRQRQRHSGALAYHKMAMAAL